MLSNVQSCVDDDYYSYGLIICSVTADRWFCMSTAAYKVTAFMTHMLHLEKQNSANKWRNTFSSLIKHQLLRGT